MPILTGPLPDDPGAIIDAAPLAAELRRALAEAQLALAPKVSVVIDGGGALHLDALSADIRLRAVGPREAVRWLLALQAHAGLCLPLPLKGGGSGEGVASHRSERVAAPQTPTQPSP